MRFKGIFAAIFAVFYCVFLSAQVDFYADDTLGCAGMRVKFSLDHTTIDTNSTDSVVWDFGIGPTVKSFNPSPITYSQPGKYTVSIVIDGNTGSPITKTDYIEVHEVVQGDFDFDIVDSPYGYRFNPQGTIDTDTTSFLWEIYDNSTNRISNITFINRTKPSTAYYDYNFPDTGSYVVKLKATTTWTSGTQTGHCTDTTSQTILVEIPQNDSVFHVGNVFSPSTQTFFVIEPTDPDIILSFIVFSRTGVAVYKEESPVIYWDGRTNSGQDLSTGVYFYVLEALQNDASKRYSTRGFIHLFR
jgi:hypothetical protein